MNLFSVSIKQIFDECFLWCILVFDDRLGCIERLGTGVGFECLDAGVGFNCLGFGVASFVGARQAMAFVSTV